MRKVAVVSLAGYAGSTAGSCVVYWLESRHRLLGRHGTVRLRRLLLIRPSSEFFDQREYGLPSSPTGCHSRTVFGSLTAEFISGLFTTTLLG